MPIEAGNLNSSDVTLWKGFGIGEMRLLSDLGINEDCPE